MTKQTTPNKSQIDADGLDALVTARMQADFALANIPFEIASRPMTISQIEQAALTLGVEPASWFRTRES